VPERHFLRDLKKQLSVGFIRLAQQPAKLVEIAGLFANTAPCNVIRRFSLVEVWQFRRFLAFVEQLIERTLKSAGKFSLTSRWLERWPFSTRDM
jgi:hypothetical protein